MTMYIAIFEEQGGYSARWLKPLKIIYWCRKRYLYVYKFTLNFSFFFSLLAKVHKNKYNFKTPGKQKAYREEANIMVIK